jgi:hypothetical protein
MSRFSQVLHLLEVHGCSRSDALIEEIVFAVPNAGVMVGLGLEQANGGAQAIAALKRLKTGSALWPADGETDAARDWGLHVLGVCNHFQRRDAEIEALGRPLQRACCARLIEILFDLRAHRAGIHDRSFNRAQQAIRERSQRGRGSRAGLHLRAPGAQQAPQYAQRQPRNA